ncbi:MAG: GntR family transcriptional regulator [Propionibacteriaceae bacterium]|nr:GntR family transcriptional regulator [Propionibacteriaceae bacterium]
MTDVFATGRTSPSPAPWRQTAQEYAQETLRQAILDGSLPGGTRLVQSEIAYRLGVSTTPVREALRQLAADGLVNFDAHVGAVVRRLEKDELVEVYDLLMALCPLALERAAAHLTAEELDQAMGYLKRSASTDIDAPAWANLHVEFHAVLEQASRAPTLSSILRNLHESAAIHVIRALKTSPFRRDIMNREHEEIIEVLRTGDGKRAGEMMVTHLSETLRLLLESFEAERREEEDSWSELDLDRRGSPLADLGER